METEVRVSVVVPMYNCAEYLPEFFSAMMNQTFRDFEMICVIDGATDSTLDIVRSYAEEDGRIRWYCKENGGAGSARNYGFSHARGEYVIWLDADDRYEENLLEEMVSAAERHNADEVLCLFTMEDLRSGELKENRGFKKEVFPENACTDPHEIPRLFQAIASRPTNKLYRRSFVEEHGLKFSETHVANDIFFTSAAISVAGRVAAVHKHLLHVRRYVNPGSITSNRAGYIDEIVPVFHSLYRWLEDNNLAEHLRDSYCISMVGRICDNAEFGINSKYIEALVHELNEEQPWKEMDQETIFSYSSKLFDTCKMEKTIKELETGISNGTADPVPDPRVTLARLKNKRATILIIEALSEAKYGRYFERDHAAELEAKIDGLKRSWNFRIGAAITWLPRKLFGLINRIKLHQ